MKLTFLASRFAMLVTPLGLVLSGMTVSPAGIAQEASPRADVLAGVRAVRHEVEVGRGLLLTREEQIGTYAGVLEDLAALTLAGTPAYRVTVVGRAYYDPPRETTVSKELSHYDDGEMHAEDTQIYVILEGAGEVIVGGEPRVSQQSQGTNYAGGPVEGGEAFRVSPGDMVVIPPLTWHQAIPDEGGLSYTLIHIRTPTSIP